MRFVDLKADLDVCDLGLVLAYRESLGRNPLKSVLSVARRVAELFEECPDDYHQERAEGFHEDSSECPTCWGAGVVAAGKARRMSPGYRGFGPGDNILFVDLAGFLFGEGT